MKKIEIPLIAGIVTVLIIAFVTSMGASPAQPATADKAAVAVAPATPTAAPVKKVDSTPAAKPPSVRPVPAPVAPEAAPATPPIEAYLLEPTEAWKKAYPTVPASTSRLYYNIAKLLEGINLQGRSLGETMNRVRVLEAVVAKPAETINAQPGTIDGNVQTSPAPVITERK